PRDLHPFPTRRSSDLFEINEAFGAQAAYCVRELGVPADKLNPNGGAIALGHPLGVSGTRMTATLLRELARRKGRYGIVSMCIGRSEEHTSELQSQSNL